MDRSRIGPFALEEPLSARGEGAVFRGFHVEQRKSVAIRFIPAPLIAGNRTARQQYSNELAELKRLRHPNIVRCYGGGFGNMEVYIANELVAGESLGSLLQRRGQLPWEMVVEYAVQICLGMEFAHNEGFVHGALCPDKVLIGEAGEIKTADWRQDRSKDASHGRPLEQPLESLAYYAPEQFDVNAPASAKADLYALGCIMFEMLTGQRVFGGLTAAELAEQHASEPPPRVATIVLDCPIWLDVLVGQLLDKDPVRRPHSARTVILALKETKKNVAAGTGVAEHAVSGISPIRAQVDKQEVRKLLGRKKRRRSDESAFYESPWFLGACLLLIIGGAATWLLWPASPSRMAAKADKLMESDDRYDWEHARKWYLEPLLEDYADTEYGERARAHMDVIEMDLAERRLRVNTRLGREPRSEGERLFAEAWNFEQFGDRISALEKYEGMVTLLDPDSEERPYVNLARRQIEAIQSNESDQLDRVKFIESRLAAADELRAEGDEVQARKIWNSIITLYGNNRELRAQTDIAQDRLESRDD